MQATILDSSTVECAAPANWHGSAVPLAVSTNGADFSQKSLRSAYVDVPKVITVTPSLGSSYGGDLLRLVGEGFLRTPNLSCRFGRMDEKYPKVTPATFESDTDITCETPEMRRGGTVWVEVTLNGFDYSESGMGIHCHSTSSEIHLSLSVAWKLEAPL